jgi:hypothetical protein
VAEEEKLSAKVEFNERSCFRARKYEEWVALMTEIVNVKNFLSSIRETGYRSFAHTLAELIDNSLQAGATDVSITVNPTGTGHIFVADNGSGMAPEVLRTALQFGGSSRFGDRSGAGRFGMGLPTSSITLARRVDVYTWRGGTILHSFLDIDKLQTSQRASLPLPNKVSTVPFALTGTQGTVVILTRCDRGGKIHDPAHVEQTKFELRRIFRYALPHFVLKFNNDRLAPFDPLFVSSVEGKHCAAQYGPVLQYRWPVGAVNGLVEVRFSELPVGALRELPNADKQKLGISRGAGVSIVRGNREIAYGWYFLGSKRRENYDDWWRCEVKFQPDLDEIFGVNHTKQQINPSRELDRLLTPDLEHIGRILNARVRQEFQRLARLKPSAPAKAARLRDRYLPSLMSPQKTPVRDIRYRIEIDSEMVDNSFYRSEIRASEVVVYLNARHPIAPLYTSAKNAATKNIEALEYLILAAARAELSAPTSKARWWFRQFRTGWSDTLAAFLGN